MRIALHATLGGLCLLAPATDYGQIAPLQQQQVTFQLMLSDQFTWIDSNGNQRVAVLAHNDQNGPQGTHGGELREFIYQVGGNPRTVIAADTSNAAGFGYIVSHPKEDVETCLGGGLDTSSFGHLIAGTWSRVFTGRHHAIFRFQQNYPRYCTTGGAAENDLPVTIDWVFSSGRDNPLWAVTYDLSGVAANVLYDDSRAPYGELLFDGSATEAAHSVIAGVGWGDGYKFTSLTNPVTFSSEWDWSVANTIPYAKLWTTNVDATMGTVQTQTLDQQDAGGYFDASKWGTTSALAGQACAGIYTMPCDYNWDYQIINYSLNQPDPTTHNTRLAWGTEFGFLGQTVYDVNGSSAWGGPRGAVTASGYPLSKKKSYSTYIVLGTHTNDPVDAQVAQVEAIQSMTLSTNAGVGSVVMAGPSGAADSTSVTYMPAGYNHVYGALAFNAAANQLDANVTLSNGKTLKNPLIIVSGYAGSDPPSVTLDGMPLVADTGFFSSVRTAPNELWITLNANLSAALHHLQISSSGAPPAPTGLSGKAITSTRIDLTWNAVAGATYQIDRESSLAGGFVQIATPPTNSFSDTGLAAGAAYVYRVRAVTAGGTSANSARHVSTTVVYTDNPVAFGIVVKATHLAELRSAVTAVRTLAALGAVGFTDAATAGTLIKAVHITELRIDLDPALTALGIATSPYTDNALAGATVKAVHFQELRDRMQ